MYFTPSAVKRQNFLRREKQPLPPLPPRSPPRSPPPLPPPLPPLPPERSLIAILKFLTSRCCRYVCASRSASKAPRVTASQTDSPAGLSSSSDGAETSSRERR